MINDCTINIRNIMYYKNAKHERQVVNQLIDIYDQDEFQYDEYIYPPDEVFNLRVNDLADNNDMTQLKIQEEMISIKPL